MIYSDGFNVKQATADKKKIEMSSSFETDSDDENRRKVSYLSIDSRDNRRVFIGYEDGMAEIRYSSNLEPLLTTVTRRDLGPVSKILLLDDPFLCKRYEYASLVLVHAPSSLTISHTLT